MINYLAMQKVLSYEEVHFFFQIRHFRKSFEVYTGKKDQSRTMLDAVRLQATYLMTDSL